MFTRVASTLRCCWRPDAIARERTGVGVSAQSGGERARCGRDSPSYGGAPPGPVTHGSRDSDGDRYAGGGGRPRSSGTAGSAARNIAARWGLSPVTDAVLYCETTGTSSKLFLRGPLVPPLGTRSRTAERDAPHLAAPGGGRP